MPRYAAFLRAVNVGGRIVKMEALRTLLTGTGLSNVQTFIASGNVVFDSPQRSVGKLEQAMEKTFADALGFSVTTFVRTLPELAALAEHPRLSGSGAEKDTAVFVAFVREKPGRDVTRKLVALNTDVDEFEVHGNHVLCTVRGRFLESQLSGPLLERTLGVPATVRNATTVRRMVQKFIAR
jgi:uncharacterized protein (DUF1697 family)